MSDYDSRISDLNFTVFHLMVNLVNYLKSIFLFYLPQYRYFLFDMDIGPAQLPSFQKELKLDTDLIRPRLIKQKPKKKVDEVFHCWKSHEKHNS